ncbi:MAG: hypothetical protein SFV52_10215 [Saprospiraceae bacterium]|nr:hypothetical protein [Saprospiraceae bacterium]
MKVRGTKRQRLFVQIPRLHAFSLDACLSVVFFYQKPIRQGSVRECALDDKTTVPLKIQRRLVHVPEQRGAEIFNCQLLVHFSNALPNKDTVLGKHSTTAAMSVERMRHPAGPKHRTPRTPNRNFFTFFRIKGDIIPGINTQTHDPGIIFANAFIINPF